MDHKVLLSSCLSSTVVSLLVLNPAVNIPDYIRVCLVRFLPQRDVYLHNDFIFDVAADNHCLDIVLFRVCVRLSKSNVCSDSVSTRGACLSTLKYNFAQTLRACQIRYSLSLSSSFSCIWLCKKVFPDVECGN